MSFEAVDLATLVPRLAFAQVVALDVASNAGAKVRVQRHGWSRSEYLYVFTSGISVRRRDAHGDTLRGLGFARAPEYRNAWVVVSHYGDPFKTPWALVETPTYSDEALGLIYKGGRVET